MTTQHSIGGVFPVEEGQEKRLLSSLVVRDLHGVDVYADGGYIVLPISNTRQSPNTVVEIRLIEISV